MIMGKQEKFMNEIMKLKFTSTGLKRQARKCENEEKTNNLKVKKAMDRGVDKDGTRMYAENTVRKRNEQKNYDRLASRLDAIVSSLDTHAKMTTITKSLGFIVKSLKSSLTKKNLHKVSKTMYKFEKQSFKMDVQAELIDRCLSGVCASSATSENEVNSLMQQVADECGLKVDVQADLMTRRLAELKARGTIGGQGFIFL